MTAPAHVPVRDKRPGLVASALTVLRDIRNLASDHLELIALEAQRASMGLVKILCAAIVVSILVVTAWIALIAGAIVWATSAGISWPWALLVAALANLIVGAIILFWIRGQVPELMFSATLRQFRRDALPADDTTEHS